MQVLYLIFAIAGLLWAGVIMLRGGLIAGCLVVLLAGTCFGHAFYHLPAKPIPVTLDRALLVALAAQFAVFWKMGLADPKAWGKSEFLLVALLAVLGLSAISHDWTINNNQPASRLVFFYGMPFVMYWIARQSAISSRQIIWICGGCAIFGLYLAFTAAAEVHQLWTFVLPTYISSEKFTEYLGRGRGPFLNPTGCGLIITLCMCCALTFWRHVDRLGKLILVGVMLVSLCGIYYSLTRSVWAGAAMALLIMIAAELTPRARVGLVVASLLAGGVFLAFRWESLTRFKRDRDVTAADMSESAELRPLLAAVSWQMFLDRPLAGCGFGQYAQRNKNYVSDRSQGLNLEKTRPYVQHNVFLALLTETGLLGAGVFVALLATWAVDAWRLWRSPSSPLQVRQFALVFLAFLAAYLINGMFHDVAIVPHLHMYFFFFAALVSGLAASARRDILWQRKAEEHNEDKPGSNLGEASTAALLSANSLAPTMN
ncbi:MAG: O-antigen ligase family protein [Pirellulales bacterium]|nr:O-antigen ligase family protein [Pirellulales bacterium]